MACSERNRLEWGEDNVNRSGFDAVKSDDLDGANHRRAYSRAQHAGWSPDKCNPGSNTNSGIIIDLCSQNLCGSASTDCTRQLDAEQAYCVRSNPLQQYPTVFLNRIL